MASLYGSLGIEVYYPNLSSHVEVAYGNDSSGNFSYQDLSNLLGAPAAQRPGLTALRY